MMAAQENPINSLNSYILKLTCKEKKLENNCSDLFDKSLSALKLIQKVPALRHNYHNIIYLLFEESLNLYISRPVNYEKNAVDVLWRESMEKLIREIKILIRTNNEFWGLAFFQWTIEFFVKQTLKFDDTFFNIDIDLINNYFYKSDAIELLAIVLQYIVNGIRINSHAQLEQDFFGVLISNTISIYPKSLWMFSMCSVIFCNLGISWISNSIGHCLGDNPLDNDLYNFLSNKLNDKNNNLNNKIININNRISNSIDNPLDNKVDNKINNSIDNKTNNRISNSIIDNDLDNKVNNRISISIDNPLDNKTNNKISNCLTDNSTDNRVNNGISNLNTNPIDSLIPKFYDYLLQTCLISYSCKFNTSNIMMELISLSLYSNNNHDEIFIDCCVRMVNDALSEPNSNPYSFTLPMILNLASNNLYLFEKYFFKFLAGINFNACAFRNHINYFEEKHQIDLNHKTASILMNFPQYDLILIDFLVKSLKQKNSIVPLFVTVFIIITDYARDVVNLKSSGSVPLVSTHFLARFQNNIPFLIKYIFNNFNSISSNLIFSLLFSIGYFGGLSVMTNILLALLHDDIFNIIRFNFFHRLICVFSLKFHHIDKKLFFYISKDFNTFSNEKFIYILKNLTLVILYERKLFSTRSNIITIEKGFENSYFKFLSLIPNSNPEVIYEIINFFNIFNSNNFKKFKTLNDSYTAFQIILELIYMIANNNLESTVIIWKFISKIIRLIFLSAAGFKHIFMQKIIENLIFNNFYEKINNDIFDNNIYNNIFENLNNDKTYINNENICNSNNVDSKNSILNNNMFDDFLKYIKNDNKNIFFPKYKRFEILVFFQSFFLNLLSTVLNPGDTAQEVLQSELNIYCMIFVKTILKDVEIDIEWPHEEKLYIRDCFPERFSNLIFDQPILRFFLQVISHCKPKCEYYGVIIRLLLSSCLISWSSIKSSKPTPKLVDRTEFLLKILLSSEWLPIKMFSITEMIKCMKPLDVYYLLSCIWSIYQNKTEYYTSTTEDSSGNYISFNHDDLLPLFSFVKAIIFKDVASMGQFFVKIFK